MKLNAQLINCISYDKKIKEKIREFDEINIDL